MICIFKIGPIMTLSVSDRYQQNFYFYRFPDYSHFHVIYTMYVTEFITS